MSNAIQIIGILVGLGVLGGGFYVVQRVRAVSKTVFGTTNLVEGLEQQKLMEDNTPKTVSGMTSLELPRIKKDFPEFDWPEWKTRCENQLKGYLECLEHQSTSYLSQASEPLTEQVRLQIEDNAGSGIHQTFDQIRIHQTEIKRYDKSPGICKISIQTALEYLYSSWTDGEPEKNCQNQSEKTQPREPSKEQHRYNMELVYIQDVTKLGDQATTFGQNCPHCGAPITNLGELKCSYCGSALIPVNIRVWTLEKIEKMIK